MKRIRRNDPCPCGSGVKFKKCWGTSPFVKLAGLTPGLRMKGGVAYDPERQRWIVIVHIWDNIACDGEPDEWQGADVFDTEDAAMQFYTTIIRPALEGKMKEMEKQHAGMSSMHRRME